MLKISRPEKFQVLQFFCIEFHFPGLRVHVNNNIKYSSDQSYRNQKKESCDDMIKSKIALLNFFLTKARKKTLTLIF
jgi:hypothetical protein